MQVSDPAAIAEGLTELERNVARALLPMSWHGDKATPGINELERVGLMQVSRLGGRFKASPTPLGLAVREILQEQETT